MQDMLTETKLLMCTTYPPPPSPVIGKQLPARAHQIMGSFCMPLQFNSLAINKGSGDYFCKERKGQRKHTKILSFPDLQTCILTETDFLDLLPLSSIVIYEFISNIPRVGTKIILVTRSQVIKSGDDCPQPQKTKQGRARQRLGLFYSELYGICTARQSRICV